jgi:hypothetical protein
MAVGDFADAHPVYCLGHRVWINGKKERKTMPEGNPYNDPGGQIAALVTTFSSLADVLWRAWLQLLGMGTVKPTS